MNTNDENKLTEVVKSGESSQRGGIIGWFCRFLDRYVKETPSAWLVPVVAYLSFLIGMMPGGFTGLLRDPVIAANGTIVGYGLMFFVLSALLVAPIGSLFVYWVNSGITHLFMMIVGGRGFVLTRRFMLYIGVMDTLAIALIALLFVPAVLNPVLMGVMLIMAIPLALAYWVFRYMVAYKGFNHLMGLSVGRFLLGYFVLPIVSIIVVAIFLMLLCGIIMLIASAFIH